MSIPAAADITVGEVQQHTDTDVHRLFLLQEQCTSLFVKTSVKYPQVIITMKLTKFTVLYTAIMKGGQLWLRKSYSTDRNGINKRCSAVFHLMCGVSSKLMFESCANVTVNAAILDPAICVCDLTIKKEQTNMAAPQEAQNHSKKKTSVNTDRTTKQSLHIELFAYSLFSGQFASLHQAPLKKKTTKQLYCSIGTSS